MVRAVRRNREAPMSAPEKPEMTAGEIREYADRMEAEPSADEASAIDAAHYAIMEAVGGTVCNPRTCRVMPILRRLALAIAAIREAPAQADAHPNNDAERALAEERRQLCEILDAALDPDKKEDDDNG